MKSINSDGSIAGQTFSKGKYSGEHPYPKKGDTYRSYRERVNEARELGFHLGDLSWSNWGYYCMGSGNYDGVDADNYIPS